MFRKILVAVDLDDDSQNENLLRVTAEMANSNGADVYLLNVIGAAPSVVSQFLPESYEKMASAKIEQELTAVAADIDLPDGVKDICVRFGDVYKEILAHAENIAADLIIVASHRPQVRDFLLGTTAARIVRHALCSTLVVRRALEMPDD